MEDKKRKFPLSIYELILILIIVPIVFYLWTKLLWSPSFKELINIISTEPVLFVTLWGPLIIIGFDFLWLIYMFRLSNKNLRIKIYATVFLMTISAATLYFGFVVSGLRGAMDMS